MNWEVNVLYLTELKKNSRLNVTEELHRKFKFPFVLIEVAVKVIEDFYLFNV